MKNLEELTREIFQNYTNFKTNKSLNWNKLSDERKQVWLTDVYFIIKMVLEDFEKELKIQPINKSPKASYELGYVRGSETEKQRLRHLISDMKTKYFKDINNS